MSINTIAMDRSSPREFGVVNSDEVNEKQPLTLAVQFLDDFMRRDRLYPDLKEQLQASRHKIDCPDKSAQNTHSYFSTRAVALPHQLQTLEKSNSGILPELDLVWVTSDKTAYLWNYKKQDALRKFAEMDEPVVAVHCATPKPHVFVEGVSHLIVLYTSTTIKVFAVNNETFFDTGFSLKHNVSGIPEFIKVPNRIIFTVQGALYELEYRAKESWFRSKVQLHQVGGSSWFKGGNGDKTTQATVDLSRNKIYTLYRNSIARYDFSHGIRFEHHLPAQKYTITGISATTKAQSLDEVLILITSTGSRIYISHDRSFPREVENPAPTQETLKVVKASAFNRDTFVNVLEDGIFMSSVDSTRMIHLVDQHAALSLSEVTTSLPIKNITAMAQVSPCQNSGNQAVLQYTCPATEVALLTGDTVHFIRVKNFYELFEREGTLPANITQMYGHIELCCAALCVATRPATALSGPLRDQALTMYHRFGGIPVFQRDLEANRYTYALDPQSSVGAKENPKVGIRLSSSFDGLACYISRLLADIWSKSLFSYERKGGELSNLKLNVDKSLFENLHQQLRGLSVFLESSTSTSASSSSAASDKNFEFNGTVGENSLLNQAELKSVGAMAQLVKSCQQGIAFLLLLHAETLRSEAGLKSLLEYVSADLKESLLNMTFKAFFSEAKHSEVARELVTCLINFIINRGDSIDSVAAIIQDRCETYCSASDVLVYKALQYLHSAKSSPENDLKIQKLYKSAGLFVRASSNISFETLKNIVDEYVALEFYPGAINVALAAAAEIDRSNIALSYLRDGKPENDARQKIYEQKTRYYNLIFEILDKVNLAPKSELYNALLDSKDEVFHYHLYDWFLEHKPELLRSVDSPYIKGYLQKGATRDVRLAELLWKHYIQQDDLLAAADVLLDLAKGTLAVPMIQRVELLSRAMGYCKCQFPESSQRQVFELGTMVSAYLKIANVQAEIYDRVQNDNSLDTETRTRALKALSERLLTVSDLFNDFAEPFHYYDVCLSLFEVADFTDPVEVMQCYDRLLETTRLQDATEGTQHYAHVSALMRALGRRFAGARSLFPVGQLKPFLERYQEQHCPDAPQNWVQQVLAGY